MRSVVLCFLATALPLGLSMGLWPLGAAEGMGFVFFGACMALP